MITLEQAKDNLTAAWQAFDEQEETPQTRGDSIGAGSISYWSKVVKLLEAGVEVPQRATARQITNTPIDVIRQGYIYCCDYTSPYGYQALLKIDWLGLTQEQIEAAKWVERSLDCAKHLKSDEEKVNAIRHQRTPYEAWLRRGDDYLTVFMRANLLIAERIPELSKTAIAQIGRKRNSL